MEIRWEIGYVQNLSYMQVKLCNYLIEFSFSQSSKVYFIESVQYNLIAKLDKEGSEHLVLKKLFDLPQNKYNWAWLIRRRGVFTSFPPTAPMFSSSTNDWTMPWIFFTFAASYFSFFRCISFNYILLTRVYRCCCQIWREWVFEIWPIRINRFVSILIDDFFVLKHFSILS